LPFQWDANFSTTFVVIILTQCFLKVILRLINGKLIATGSAFLKKSPNFPAKIPEALFFVQKPAKMRSYLALFALLFLANCVLAQTPTDRPKLVVGIVVDQMRYDYLYRYWDKYSSGGFKRLITQGFNCRNNHYAYAFTETGPGHATIYTGTTPSVHGIVSNMWYDKRQERMVYCAEDKTVTAVGAPSNDALLMSPRNLLVTTLGDELKLATNHRAKVIGVALKVQTPTGR
jgi:hypothetical protein